MPLPQRKPGEGHDEFIERCMADPVMVEEFPDAAQRRAVCEQRSKMRSESHLNFVCEPGSITIEASSEDAAADSGDKPKLPRFTMVAYTGGPMRIAGWRYPVIVDLAGLVIPSQSRPIRFGHDMQSGVGHTDAIRIEDGKLVATGVVSRDTQVAREVVVSARNGFPWQASIGASVEEYEFVTEGQSVIVNGRQFAGPVNVVRKATLGEISFVDLGADSATSATVAAQAVKESAMDSDQVKDTTAVEPPVAANKPTPDIQSGNDAAEVARVRAIQELCGNDAVGVDVAIEAISKGWTAQQAALECLRRRRPHVAVIREGADDFQRDVVAGITENKPSRWRGIGLQALARACCELEGVALRSGASPMAVIEAAFSTRSLPSILKESAQKVLLDGYAAVDKASLKVAKILEAVDFKTHTLARLTGQYRLEKVAADGELPHANVSDAGYTIKVDTYGRLVGLTRQDVINDDLGAFLEVPRQLGRGAALALENAFWTMVEAANGTFFAAGNNNVITGTTSAFGVAALNSAIAKLRKQKDADGNPIKARPRYVAVPPDLEADATQIYTSNVLLIAGQLDRTIGANNPHANKYEPVVSEYLTGNGASSVWYLVADPFDVPAFGIAFLRGQTEPTIEEASPDPRYLGTLWRGYFDFGVALLDPRGAVRANGSG